MGGEPVVGHTPDEVHAIAHALSLDQRLELRALRTLAGDDQRQRHAMCQANEPLEALVGDEPPDREDVLGAVARAHAGDRLLRGGSRRPSLDIDGVGHDGRRHTGGTDERRGRREGGAPHDDRIGRSQAGDHERPVERQQRPLAEDVAVVARDEGAARPAMSRLASPVGLGMCRCTSAPRRCWRRQRGNVGASGADSSRPSCPTWVSIPYGVSRRTVRRPWAQTSTSWRQPGVARRIVSMWRSMPPGTGG